MPGEGEGGAGCHAGVAGGGDVEGVLLGVGEGEGGEEGEEGRGAHLCGCGLGVVGILVEGVGSSSDRSNCGRRKGWVSCNDRV